MYNAPIINQHATKRKLIRIILQCLQQVLDVIKKKLNQMRIKALEIISLYIRSLYDLCILSVGTWREWTRRTSTPSLHQTVPSNSRDRSAVSWGMWRPNQSCWKVSKNNLSSLFYLHYRWTFSIYIDSFWQPNISYHVTQNYPQIPVRSLLCFCVVSIKWKRCPMEWDVLK